MATIPRFTPELIKLDIRVYCVRVVNVRKSNV